MQYDGYKVHAVLNEIDGFDHSRTTKVGTPAIFGMNFQTVSTAEKLPVSGGLPGGYLADGVTPGPLLTGALDFIDAQVGAMVAELKARGLRRSTVIVLSAKHGQSPNTPSALTRIPDGPIMDGLNAAWTAAHPGAGDLVAFAIDDDGMLIWLNDRSDAATSFAKAYLLGHSGVGNDINGNPKPYTSSGLRLAFAGADAAAYFGAPRRRRARTRCARNRAVRVGLHREAGQDRRARRRQPAGSRRRPGRERRAARARQEWHHRVDSAVETTQIAPTILQLLGLDPQALQAVQAEHTRSLLG